VISGPPAAGVRVDYPELPAAVRHWVNGALGEEVVSASTQPQGFSPGVAARLTGATGRRAFLKAVSADANPDSPEMHRVEADVLEQLPTDAPAPRLLARFDDGTWVALLLEDVDGRHPLLPWRSDELDAVLAAAQRLADALTPSPIELRTVGDRLREMFHGWRTLATEAREGVPDWADARLADLAELEAEWEQAASGETLLHCDIRADNVLLDETGVWFVDWPHACVGAAFVDLALFAPSVRMQGGPAPDELLERTETGRAADPDRVLRVAVAAAGYLVERSLLPPPPGLPTVRAFQAAQAEVALDWVRRLTGW
jgi:aminoglycoside phosphotransferase (APT) family kinase protein